MKKTLLFLVLLVFLLGGVFGYRYYQMIWAANVKLPSPEKILLVKTNADFESVKDSLAPYLKDLDGFIWVAEKKSYPQLIKAGRYLIQDGWSNQELIDHLRSGQQEPVNLVINNIKNLADLAGVLGASLESDSAAFFNYLQDPENLRAFGLEKHTVLSVFLPNSYQFYWNSSPKFTLNRFHQESEKFWEQRASQLERTGLSPLEIITLASIVESETAQPDEMPTVAGLYLNRLRRGIKLQSDPTVIFALQQAQPDLQIRRVLYKHLEYQSPYNTYLYPGLPPGPIRLPSMQAIEAVLNYREHNFIFMVADPDRPGYHDFATNLREHNRKRQKYIRWLESNGIR